MGTSANGYGGNFAGGIVGVSGFASNSGYGVAGVGLNGVSGCSQDFNGNGVLGDCHFGPEGWGVVGQSDTGAGVVGRAGTDPIPGNMATTGCGVFGYSETGKGVCGMSVTGLAGSFEGDVCVTGNLDVGGSLSKGGGSFKIDHPLDPEDYYLYHSFVESPDMKNIYDGVAILDGNGEAWVQMPDWFGALNRDFRYQLTAVGAPAPNLYVARKIEDDRFLIAGGVPGAEVSWQVTGIRKDAWAEAHRIPVEEPKPENKRGSYLHPKERGMPEELGEEYVPPRASQKVLPRPPTELERLVPARKGGK